MMSAFDYESGNQLKHIYIKDLDGNEIKGQPLVFDSAISQLKIQFWHINGMCIKKSILHSLGGFQERMRWLEITDIQIRCALARPKVIICPVLLHRVVDVPKSASKVSLHVIQGMREMAENLYRLSKEYPDHSGLLASKSRENYFLYAAKLILSNKHAEARRFLARDFPFEHDRRWWKMWAGSWTPKFILQHLMGKEEA
jgi:hypothetical protein